MPLIKKYIRKIIKESRNTPYDGDLADDPGLHKDGIYLSLTDKKKIRDWLKDMGLTKLDDQTSSE